jgi:ADP-glucose pyrophosphorylase
MDYTELLNFHRQRGADVTIATTPADEEHATHLGVLTVWAVQSFLLFLLRFWGWGIMSHIM